MLSFLAANLSTIVVGAAVFGLVGLSLRATIRGLKSGKCAGVQGLPGRMQRPVRLPSHRALTR